MKSDFWYNCATRGATATTLEIPTSSRQLSICNLSGGVLYVKWNVSGSDAASATDFHRFIPNNGTFDYVREQPTDLLIHNISMVGGGQYVAVTAW